MVQSGLPDAAAHAHSDRAANEGSAADRPAFSESGAALVAAARSVEPTARRANETAVVLPVSNSGLSVHTDPHSDGKRRLSGKLLAPLPFRHQRGGNL